MFNQLISNWQDIKLAIPKVLAAFTRAVIAASLWSMTTRVYFRKLPIVQARLVDGAVPVFKRRVLQQRR